MNFHKPWYVRDLRQHKNLRDLRLHKNLGRPFEIGFEIGIQITSAIESPNIALLEVTNHSLQGNETIDIINSILISKDRTHRSLWAIRRMHVHTKRKCFGMVAGNNYTNMVVSRSGHSSTMLLVRDQGKEIPQWMWFCDHDVEHTWTVNKIVKHVSQLPLEEYVSLMATSFGLKEMVSPIKPHN